GLGLEPGGSLTPRAALQRIPWPHPLQALRVSGRSGPGRSLKVGRGCGTVCPCRGGPRRVAGVLMAHTGTARARRTHLERHRAAGRKRTAGKLVFLREFLRRPGQLGTCFTSTRALSRKMVEGLALSHCRSVIELGPGPGPVTAEIVARIGPQ